MKWVTLIFVFIFTCNCIIACDREDQKENIEIPVLPETPTNPGPEAPGDSNEQEVPDETNKDNMKIKVTIGSTTFTATLVDNATAIAFKELLPLTIRMDELNHNEKYYNLPQSLPTAPSGPGTIHSGDLMLWGADCLVLFYKTFPTSYRYTPLGAIDNPVGLETAVGSGNVIVTFEEL